MERAMKMQEVILGAMAKHITWWPVHGFHFLITSITHSGLC